jgi:hypothetical protein
LFERARNFSSWVFICVSKCCPTSFCFNNYLQILNK